MLQLSSYVGRQVRHAALSLLPLLAFSAILALLLVVVAGHGSRFMALPAAVVLTACVVMTALLAWVVVGESITVIRLQSRAVDVDHDCMDDEESAVSTQIMAAIDNVVDCRRPHPNQASLDDDECPLCLEELLRETSVSVLYDGHELRLHVNKAALTKCWTCRKAFHASCMCKHVASRALNGTTARCPACASAL